MGSSNSIQVQKRPEAFESYVVGFMKRIGFIDVNGGRDFKIGNIQVDACGGHEDTLIVVECRSAGKKTARSIRKDVQEIRGRMSTLVRGRKQMSVYLKYRKCKLVLATKNIEFGETDRRFASGETPRVYIWDEQFLEYYSNLAKSIDKYARFSLLSEMDVEPRIKTLASVPAFRTRLSNYPVYWFFIEPQKLLKVAYVARREIGKEQYYQRILQPKRLGKIREFLSKRGIFPTNIVVSFTKAPKFTLFQQDWQDWPNWLEFGVMTFPEIYRACWIIDGQHRLYALADPRLTAPPKIAVLGFEKLPEDKQMQFFVEINDEAKPVESDLLWDLRGEMSPNSDRGVISRIVKRLAECKTFEQRIYIPLAGAKKRGKLKLSGICSAIEGCRLSAKVTGRMHGIHKNPLWSSEPDKRVNKIAKTLEDYFTIADALFTDEQKNIILRKNTTMEVCIEICERIIAALNHSPTKEEYQKYSAAFKEAISDIYPRSPDLRKLLGRCASKGGRAEVIAELEEKIRKITGDDNFGEKHEMPRDEEELTEFERGFAKFVIDALGVDSWDALRRVAPKDLCKRASSRQATTIDEALTLAECKEIILLPGNWPTFEDTFLNGTARFEDKGGVETALGEVSQYRNKVKHGRRGQIRLNEPEICRLRMEHLRKCMGI